MALHVVALSRVKAVSLKPMRGNTAAVHTLATAAAVRTPNPLMPVIAFNTQVTALVFANAESVCALLLLDCTIHVFAIRQHTRVRHSSSLQCLMWRYGTSADLMFVVTRYQDFIPLMCNVCQPLEIVEGFLESLAKSILQLAQKVRDVSR